MKTYDVINTGIELCLPNPDVIGAEYLGMSVDDYLSMDESERATLCRNVWIAELAQRIIDVDYYGAMDADETPETIAELLRNDPLTIISDLLDVIDEYQA